MSECSNWVSFRKQRSDEPTISSVFTFQHNQFITYDTKLDIMVFPNWILCISMNIITSSYIFQYQSRSETYNYGNAQYYARHWSILWYYIIRILKYRRTSLHQTTSLGTYTWTIRRYYHITIVFPVFQIASYRHTPNTKPYLLSYHNS